MEAAEKLFVDRASVNRFLNGKLRPRQSTIELFKMKLAHAQPGLLQVGPAPEPLREEAHSYNARIRALSPKEREAIEAMLKALETKPSRRERVPPDEIKTAHRAADQIEQECLLEAAATPPVCGPSVSAKTTISNAREQASPARREITKCAHVPLPHHGKHESPVEKKTSRSRNPEDTLVGKLVGGLLHGRPMKLK